MDTQKILSWLLSGDISIQYQAHRDLLADNQPELQHRITKEGWGAKYLSERRDDGHWGRSFYQPKWTSTHYTLLDLRNLCLPQDQPEVQGTIIMVAEQEKGADGGINPAQTVSVSDVCVNGMFLNYACWFLIPEKKLTPIVDFILSQVMPDGGFNCRRNRSGARHSSLHSTLSVLEGIEEYKQNGYSYRIEELKKAESSSRNFILAHRLFLSDRTGEIIRPDFLRLPYPARWRYDILRALDYFQHSSSDWDDRMKPAIDKLKTKRRADGTWPLQAHHPGKRHFDMEKVGKPSRWNTLRALRVLKHFNVE